MIMRNLIQILTLQNKNAKHFNNNFIDIKITFNDFIDNAESFRDFRGTYRKSVCYFKLYYVKENKREGINHG